MFLCRNLFIDTILNLSLRLHVPAQSVSQISLTVTDLPFNLSILPIWRLTLQYPTPVPDITLARSAFGYWLPSVVME